MIEEELERGDIVRQFKAYGYSLSRAALESVFSFVAEEEYPQQFLTNLLGLVTKIYHERRLASSDLTPALLE
jgi:hypothetical protein